MDYNLLNSLLDSIFQRFAENFYIYAHYGYWSVIFSSYDNFLWVWYQGNSGLIELVSVPFFSILEVFGKDVCQLFLKHLV